MPTLMIELPPHAQQTEFNLRRWDEVLADPELAKYEFRVETDRFGRAVLHSHLPPRHGLCLSEISALLHEHMPCGRGYMVCPISTADGVKAVDLAWALTESVEQLGENNCFPRAPEICIEVRLPSDSEAEVRERIALYFDAGAKEVWICDSFGNMHFFGPDKAELPASRLCPGFPARVELR